MPQGSYKKQPEGIKKKKRPPRGDQQKLRKGSESGHAHACLPACDYSSADSQPLCEHPSPHLKRRALLPVCASQITTSSRKLIGRPRGKTTSPSRYATLLLAHLPVPCISDATHSSCAPQRISKQIGKRIESTMASRGSSDGAGLSIVQVEKQQQSSGALGKRGKGSTKDIKDKKKSFH
jgi:hypothetical protein